MKRITDMIPKEVREKREKDLKESSTSNPRQRLCDNENEREGSLTGYDCRECRNKGYVVFLKGNEIVQRECSCMKTRRSLKRIEQSGLGKSIETLTFDTYIATEEWQKKAKALAERYSREGEGAWFFIGGQSGSGKTHLCTAISGKLLHEGKALKYMLWRDEATRIKALVNDYDEYDRLTNELKEAEVLYIDDFLKTQKGAAPSPADINLAFEILNYRCINRQMTIISSERGIDEITNIDEAVGGRIYALSRDYCFCIRNDKSKNYRVMQGKTQ